MDVSKDVTRSDATVPQGVDDAVGVPKIKWFVAIVNNRSEKACGEKLTNLGIECYVPTQEVVRVWKNGKRAKVDRIVIPAVVFIHCSEIQRRQLVKLPYIFRFMTNKAAVSPTLVGRPLAVVSDSEIKRLKFMLGQSDVPVEITERVYRNGDKVRIIRGSLAGLEGEVSDMKTAKSEVLVSLKYFGCAKLLIDTINLEKIKS